MRTTAFVAALPRSFDWQAGIVAKTYTAQLSPAVAWRRIPSSDDPVVKWCDGVHLTWMVRDAAERLDTAAA